MEKFILLIKRCAKVYLNGVARIYTCMPEGTMPTGV